MAELGEGQVFLYFFWIFCGRTGRRQDGASYRKSTKFIFGTNVVLTIRDAIRDLEVLAIASSGAQTLKLCM
jgi:hypothetical protein